MTKLRGHALRHAFQKSCHAGFPVGSFATRRRLDRFYLRANSRYQFLPAQSRLPLKPILVSPNHDSQRVLRSSGCCEGFEGHRKHIVHVLRRRRVFACCSKLSIAQIDVAGPNLGSRLFFQVFDLLSISHMSVEKLDRA